MSLLQQLLTEYQQQEYSPSDVYDKVTSANKRSNDTPTDIVSFGLEDSEGNIVKVRVTADQAVEFEKALGEKLSNTNSSDSAEIAEILFDLHSKFNIVDVEWPQITQDEEQQPDISMNDNQGQVADDQTIDPNAAPMNDAEPAPTSDNVTSSALDSVIQAMTADAEARRQESLAKAAEARAREAEAAARIADGKLKAEEEIADMEAFYGDQQVEKQEAKKLTKLARYRHQLKQRDSNTGEFNDYNSAEKAQDEDSNSRMMADPIESDASSQDESQQSSQDVTDALKKSGIEDEEQADGPENVNRTFKQVDNLLNYLLSLQTRGANGR